MVRSWHVNAKILGAFHLRFRRLRWNHQRENPQWCSSRAGFRSWTESTLASHSGRYLGLNKTKIQNPMLVSYFLKFSANLFKGGISIPRWSTDSKSFLAEKWQPKINHLCIFHHLRRTSNFLEAVMDVLSLYLLHNNLQSRFNPTRLYGSKSCHAQVTHCQLVLGDQAQLCLYW